MMDIHSRPGPEDSRDAFNASSHDPSLAELGRDLLLSLQNIIRSELRLARAEARVTMRFLGKQVGLGVAFIALAALGVLPFLAFLVIGLGEILNNNYWLSSLIVGTVITCVGGILAYRCFKKIGEADVTLPRFRQSIREQQEIVSRQFQDARKEVEQDMIEETRRRAA